MSPAGRAPAGVREPGGGGDPDAADGDRTLASITLGLGCGVAVRSTSAAALAELLEFFGDWQAPEADAEFVVECEVDAARWQALDRRVAGEPGTPRDIFALDTRTVRLPTWQRDGVVLARDDFCGCWYVLAEGQITVVTHAGAAHARLGLLRVVREAVCARTASPAALDLHAAAVEVAGRAVLLCGPKRAGKSSLLCHLLGSGAARFLGNDRVQLRAGAGAWCARGIPTVVRLRASMLESFPQLLRGDPERTAEALLLSPAQLCARLGAGTLAQAPVGAVLHVQIVAGGPAWSLEALARDDARSRLVASTYGAPRTQPTLIEALAQRPAAGRDRDAARALDDVAARVPQQICRLGPAAYAQPAGALVAALTALWQSPRDAGGA